ncbi:hypothetical protein HZA33_03605 [Candidatus Pacearchaeota archaeon]|nr:hypothetical protein [Candidatus Pacearchaeota archaeon]
MINHREELRRADDELRRLKPYVGQIVRTMIGRVERILGDSAEIQFHGHESTINVEMSILGPRGISEEGQAIAKIYYDIYGGVVSDYIALVDGSNNNIMYEPDFDKR